MGRWHRGKHLRSTSHKYAAFLCAIHEHGTVTKTLGVVFPRHTEHLGKMLVYATLHLWGKCVMFSAYATLNIWGKCFVFTTHATLHIWGKCAMFSAYATLNIGENVSCLQRTVRWIFGENVWRLQDTLHWLFGENVSCCCCEVTNTNVHQVEKNIHAPLNISQKQNWREFRLR